MRHLYPITHYSAAVPSKLSELDIEDIEEQQLIQLERAFYLGWDDRVEQIEARLKALDALRLTFDE